jgi:uncharacterized protein with HEPN domain
MPRRHWAIRVRDIIEAAEKIVSHTKGLDFEAFSGDDWAVDAVLRNLTVIGEAARHMPVEFMAGHPEVPWADMSDMRNIVVHEYFGVDLSIIWSTIREDLPPLIDQLKTIREKESF